MPDANLFKQTIAGINIWVGVFEGQQVALMELDGSRLDGLRFRLYKILASGALVESCVFNTDKIGYCRLTARKLSLLLQPGSQTAYISTVEKTKVHTRDSVSESTWFKDYFPSGFDTTMPSAAGSGAKCFKTLDVTSTVTEVELKSAFRAAIKKAHPDKGGSDAQSRKVLEAYEEAKRLRGFK